MRFAARSFGFRLCWASSNFKGEPSYFS